MIVVGVFVGICPRLRNSRMFDRTSDSCDPEGYTENSWAVAAFGHVTQADINAPIAQARQQILFTGCFDSILDDYA